MWCGRYYNFQILRKVFQYRIITQYFLLFIRRFIILYIFISGNKKWYLVGFRWKVLKRFVLFTCPNLIYINKSAYWLSEQFWIIFFNFPINISEVYQYSIEWLIESNIVSNKKVIYYVYTKRRISIRINTCNSQTYFN